MLISTSTPNEYIKSIAQKYNIPVTVNTGINGIGGDWNHAYDSVDTPLVTIAHQDDIYEPEYTYNMLKYINMSKNPIIYFCNYAEIRDGEKVYNNNLLKTKRIMLSPLKIRCLWQSKFVRRCILSLGCPICCPSVSMVKANFGDTPFKTDFSSNLDWQQWEIQSKKTGAFVYNDKPLMCHRIHKESETSRIIDANSRTEEDYEMFLKFWCKPIAKILTSFYKSSQKSNNT